MRNNWGLWRGKELAIYFNSIGIYHPDDMSGIILTSYYRELYGKDWEVEKQIQYYQDFWKKANEHLYKLETDTAYQTKIQVQRDSLPKARLEQKKRAWSSGKRVSGYVNCRSWLLRDFSLRTEIKGTIIEWKGDKLLLLIDSYVDENKKKRVIKHNAVKNDTILVEHHDYFTLRENR